METTLQLFTKFHLAYLLENSTTSKLPRFKLVHKFFFQITIVLLLLSGSGAVAETTWNGSSSTSSEDLAINFGLTKSATGIGSLSEEKNSSIGIVTVPNYALSAAVFTNLTASQSVCLGTTTVTLTGVVSNNNTPPPLIYATDTKTVTITINGVSQNAVIAGGAGAFTINFSLTPASSFPAGSYTITYAYAGDANLQTGTDTSTKLTVTSTPIPTVGAFSAGQSQSICSGASPANISVTGFSGILQWQQADDPGFTTNLTNLGTSSSTLSGIPALTATKYFRAVATNGACPSAISATATVAVTPAIAGNSSGADKSICENTSTTLTGGTITGGTGTYTYLWESSTALAGTYIAAAGTNTSANYTTQILTTASTMVYFRRTVTSGSCSSVATGFHVTVNPAAAVGAVSADQVICAGSSPSDITVANPVGTIQWQSADNTAFTTNLTNIGTGTATLTSASIGTLTATKYFRAQVSSGACASVFSATITVTVNPAPAVGAVSANQTICSGSSPTTNITVASATGTIQWQAADDTAFTIDTANIGTNSTTLTTSDIGILIANKYFRAQVTSGVCTSIYSGIITVTVNAAPAPNAGPDQVICANGSIALHGNIGGSATSTWSAPSGSFSNPSSLTSNYTPSIASGTVMLTLTTNDPTGICPLATSTMNVTVNASIATTGVTICPGGTGSLTSTGCATGGTATTSTGFKDAGAGANNTSLAAGNTNWVNPGNILSNDNSYATINLSNASSKSYYLIGSNYNFNIPSTATIKGIQANIGKFGTLFLNYFDRIKDYDVRLVKAGVPVAAGNNKASATTWPGTEVASNYGGATDLWGTTLTPADINDPGFGLALSVQNNTLIGHAYTASVDYMEISVTYTIADGTQWYTVSSGGTAIGTGTPFNPVGVTNSGLPNTNTAGTTIFYAECATAPGCRTATNFVINAKPSTSTITGPATVCANSTGNIYSVTNTVGSTYSWMVPTGATIATGSGTNSITVTFGTTSGNVAVTETNASTCVGTQITEAVIINALSTNLTSSDADNTFCAGTSVIFTATGGTNYNFRVAGVSVQNSTAATYTTTNLTNGQVVDVIVTNASGCTATSTGITNTVNALPTPGLTSNDADNTFCAGTSVIFTATGGTNYNFRVAGVSVQNSATATYTTTTLTNGQVVDVIVSNASGCTATTTGITNTVNPSPTAGLTSNDADNIFCQFTPVTFTATGGTNYNFRIAGVSKQNGATATYTTTGLTNGQVVDVIVTNASGCTATSTGITNTVNAPPTIGLTSSDADNKFCAGTLVTFTATGGTNYDFRIAGVSVQNSATATFTTTALTNGQVVNVKVTNAAGCTGTNTGITNTVNALPTAGLTSNDADNTFCAGTSVTFTATGGTNYNFRVAGVSMQNSATATYTTTALTNGQVVDVIVTDSSTGCAATSMGITNTVNALATTSLTSSDSDNTFCAGTSVTFTASGGTNYNFRVAGVSVQNSATATFTTTTLTNGQVVDVIVSGASGCAGTSTGINNTVNTLPAIPSIGTITQPNCTILTGSVVLNGLPSGNWTINPGTITGSGAATTISGLVAGTSNFTVTNASGCISAQSPDVILSGGNKRWAGSTNNDWFNDSNWIPAAAPTANDCVIVPNNVPQVSISDISKTAYANTLTVAGGGKLEVMSGNILVVTNSVTVDPGGTPAGTAAGTLILQDSANLIQINNSTNSGTINSIRNTAPVVLYDYTYWSSPTSGSQTLQNFSPNSNLKYFLIDNNGWFYVNPSTIAFDKGVGYAILSPSGISSTTPSSISFQFNGTPNNGTITVPVTLDPSLSSSSKLIGNPYPSALDADKFILANLGATSGTLYFWTHNQPLAAGAYPQGDYAAYNLTGGIGTGVGTTNTTGTGNPAKPTRWIASAQGFEVETQATGNVTFTNDMRTTDINYIDSNFYKSANTANAESDLEKDRIWLNLTNSNSIFSQILIGYVETATNGYDPGFDGAYIGNSTTAFYSLIGNSKFIIQARALPFTDSDVVPLGYKTDVEGNLTISIDSLDGLFTGDQPIFIEDKLLNIIQNIKSAPYTFATESGTFDSRFVLRYKDSNLGLNNLSNIPENILISSKNQQIKVQSTIQNIEKVFVYDMLGRTIYKNLEIEDKETLISDLRTQQVLIIKVVLKSGYTINKKLVNQ